MNALTESQLLYSGCPSPFWKVRADWVAEHHSQETVYAANAKLYKLLAVTPEEDPLKALIREELTLLWYAMDDVHMAKLEEWLENDGDRS